ncbi:MAG: hypothetical protein ACYS1A_16855 [Planctomycetota bacterium]|jgi:hypothetical protein
MTQQIQEKNNFTGRTFTTIANAPVQVAVTNPQRKTLHVLNNGVAGYIIISPREMFEPNAARLPFGVGIVLEHHPGDLWVKDDGTPREVTIIQEF